MLWLWIVALLLITCVWASVALLEVSLSIGIVVTVVLVLAVAGFFGFRRFRAARRASALERELSRQAGEQAKHARPGRRAEIEQLQQRMQEAIAQLKRSKLGARSGRAALYALPWYVIIGPSGAGKTTALEQSGLSFVSPGGSGAKVRGTAGTRNCDWWFGRDAILLDTAGRYATPGDDQDEWLAFLDTLRRFRPERPLDGILVAVSIGDLVGAGEAKIEEVAANLRARAEEIMGRLEMVLPMYVLFTKADLIPGFVEFWEDLAKPEREQVWGATFPLDDTRLEEPASAFDAEFARLVEVLHARLLQRLPRERLVVARAKILQFPVEFAALKAPLARFMEDFYHTNPYQDAPILRGFYFTSGTQVGSPLQSVLSNMLAGFNLRGPQGRDPQAKTLSYFLTDVFKDVVFPDRNAAFRSTASLQGRLKKQLLLAGGALLLTIAILVPAAVSYASNSALVDDTQRDIARLERIPASDTAAEATALSAISKRVRKLDEARSEFHVAGMWGPYTAPSLYEPLLRVYVARLRKVVDGPLRNEIVNDVRRAGNLARVDAENFRVAYDDLKLYLMLTDPTHLDAKWAEERLAEKWARTSGGASPDQEELSAHSRYYVQALAKQPDLAWRAEPELVSGARGALFGQRLEEIQYQWMIEKAKDVEPVLPERIFIEGAQRFFEWRKNVAVPGPYTKAGWEKIKTHLYSSEGHREVEPWVIGPSAETASAKTSPERLQQIYFTRYVRMWLDFLGGIVVHTPPDLRAATDELKALSEANGPYKRLFEAVVDNARLDMTPPATPQGVTKRVTDEVKKRVNNAVKGEAQAEAGAPEISPVEAQLADLVKFGDSNVASSGLNQYIDQLQGLTVALEQLGKAEAEPTAQFQSNLTSAVGVVQRLLASFDRDTRLVTEPLLMNPIRGSRAGVAGTAFGAMSDKWKAEVWEAYSQKLAPRYPFSETPGEVSIAEFADFFRPSTGMIWKFFEQNLSDRLERSGNAFRPKAAADPLPFHPLFLRCLNVAQEITDATFGTSSEMNVLFDLRAESSEADVTSVTFTVDGQHTKARGSAFRMQWPGKGNPKGARLQLKGAGFADEVGRNGDFGLFRLLAYGGLKPEGGEWLATFTLPRSATVSVRPSKSMHPFVPGFFRRLKCPPAVTAGGAGP
ncbi:MAG TPA: type VI secretion system membrane subunit TssM [Polyangiaceae bacterium]